MASNKRTAEAPARMLEVQERPAVADLSYIPTEIADLYESQGFRVTLASGDQNTVAQHSLNSRFPVSLDDFSQEGRPELEQILRRYGFRFRDSYIWKGDCILYSQPHDARDEQLKDALDMWMRHDQGKEEEAAEELTRELMKNPRALGYVKQDNGANGFRR